MGSGGTPVSRAASVFESAYFAYATIFLLQLKVIWGMWPHRDLTFGDTSSYFVNAWNWYRGAGLEILWSPLYTLYYGVLYGLTQDIYAATILHRVLIVVAATMLVLALMRRLLPSWLAWAAAAWWAVSAVNYDTLYEVHLFSILPVLVAVLAPFRWPGARGRGVTLGILAFSSFAVRNELSVAALLFAACCLAFEWKRSRAGTARPGEIARAYAVPIAALCLIPSALLFTQRSDSDLASEWKRKHTLNVCQAYAFGYQQRASDWKGSPWTECQTLAMRDFGEGEPTFVEAFRENPRAIFRHIRWNVQLIPSGLQMLLFDRMSGTTTPDYIPPVTSKLALPATLAAAAIMAAGFLLLIREWKYWWAAWLRERSWAWVAIGCVSAVVVIVMTTQRPRPSYMFALGIGLRALIAFFCYVIARHLPAPRMPRWAGVAAVGLVLLLAPARYGRPAGPRPLLEECRRVEPLQELLEKPSTVLVTGRYGSEVCNYVGRGRCRAAAYRDIRPQAGAAEPIEEALRRNGVTVFSAGGGLLNDPEVEAFFRRAGGNGWVLAGMSDVGGRRWRVAWRPGSGGEPGGAE